MAKVDLTDALRSQYIELFNSCIVVPKRAGDVEGTVPAMIGGKGRYQAVGGTTGAPWFFVAAIHAMEAGLSFNEHLHNGDPLTSRTLHVPAGRPPKGQPPFTWEESATDALGMRGIGPNTDWSLAGCLYQLEGYNGWGYRLHHPYVLSPYLWSFSNHYQSGKYIADGTWSDTAVSKQCGAAVLLRRLAERGEIEFSDQPASAPGGPPLVVTFSNQLPSTPEARTKALDLQRWLNTFPGVFVKVDGIPGSRTSDAYRLVTGVFLPGDPRI